MPDQYQDYPETRKWLYMHEMENVRISRDIRELESKLISTQIALFGISLLCLFAYLALAIILAKLG